MQPAQRFRRCCDDDSDSIGRVEKLSQREGGDAGDEYVPI
jgi:hypothetical protein